MRLLLQIDELGGETGEHLVEAVEVHPDDQARRDDDKRRLPGLLPVREIDLGELPRTSPVNAKSPRTPPRIPPLRSMSPPDWLLGLPAMGAVTVRRPACRFRRDVRAMASASPYGPYAARRSGNTSRTRSCRASSASTSAFVVAPLAVLARQRNQHADTGLSHWGRLLGSRAPGPAPIRQDTRDPRRATPSAGAADARLDRRPNPPRVPPVPRGAALRGDPPAFAGASRARPAVALRRRPDALDDRVGRRFPVFVEGVRRAVQRRRRQRVRRSLPRRHRCDGRARSARSSPKRSRAALRRASRACSRRRTRSGSARS